MTGCRFAPAATGYTAAVRSEDPRGDLVVRAAFAATPQSASSARRFTGAVLRRWRYDDELVERAVLLCSELVGHGFRHGGRPVRVALRSLPGQGVRLAVSDGADVRSGDPELLTPAGRRVVGATADRWGTEVTRWGRLVWCELDGLRAGPVPFSGPRRRKPGRRPAAW